MGGGTIRTAVRAAAVAGYRSAAPFAGHPTSWKPPRPASAVASAQAPAVEAGTPSICLASSESSHREVSSVSGVEVPGLEFDDWEFAGWGEGESCAAAVSSDPPPRLVFGPVPTLEEAREATSDLKDALDKVYFSPSSNESTISVRGSVHQDDLSIVPSVPRQVFQAFSLLQGSPAVQDVVASLAADKNVWNAVMNNKEVMEFYKTHQSVVLHPESGSESVGDTEVPVVDSCSESSTAEKTRNSPFADFVNNAKVKVVEMVSNISSFLQELTSNFTTKNTDKTFVDYATGASFMALAVAAILVVLTKRG